jgi:hypothetical protein
VAALAAKHAALLAASTARAAVKDAHVENRRKPDCISECQCGDPVGVAKTPSGWKSECQIGGNRNAKSVEIELAGIRRVTVKEMLMLKFYQFSQRLAARAEEEGATIIRVYEGCTPKTCTACGVIKNNVGGAETFRCTPCGVRLPRDLVGARNIFLRFLERGCA